MLLELLGVESDDMMEESADRRLRLDQFEGFYTESAEYHQPIGGIVTRIPSRSPQSIVT
jgi:hypothetical protein